MQQVSLRRLQPHAAPADKCTARQRPFCQFCSCLLTCCSRATGCWAAAEPEAPGGAGLEDCRLASTSCLFLALKRSKSLCNSHGLISIVSGCLSVIAGLRMLLKLSHAGMQHKNGWSRCF